METSKVRELRRRLEVLTREIERLESQPDDDYSPGDVITWERRFDGRPFQFAALRLSEGPRPWVVTGGRLGGMKTWDEVHAMICKAEPGTTYWVSSWEQIGWAP